MLFFVKSSQQLNIQTSQCGKVLRNATTLKKFGEINLFSNYFEDNVDLTEKMKRVEM